MNHQIDQVNPGDLITADFFNSLIGTVNDLSQRIAVLEATAPPTNRVTLRPYIGSAHVGDEITVEGSNFAVPVQLNIVTLAGIRITQFNPGTDASHLVFNVPVIQDLPQDLTFTVTNNNGSASIIIPVLPATQIPVGSLVVAAIAAATGTIQVGQTYNFPFLLDSQTNLPETYQLAVLFNNAVGSSVTAWSADARIRNSTNQNISSVTVAPGSPVTVQLSTTIPSGASSVSMALQALSTHAPNDPLLNPPATSISITVGQAPQVSDSRTTFEQFLVAPSNHLVNDAVLGPVIRSPVGQTTLARVTANFTVAGTYDYSARLIPESPSGVWSAIVSSPSVPSTSETSGSAQEIVVTLSANGADSLNSRTLEIHAERNGPGGQNFDSWFSIPVQIG